MKNNYFIVFASLFLFVSCMFLSCSSTTPVPKNNYADIPGDFFGIVHAGETRSREEYNFLNKLNSKWVLSTFYWSRIENVKGYFFYSTYDDFVDMAKKENKKVLAVLGYDTPWLESKKKNYISPENIPHFLYFVEKTVKHFKGRVDVWQIWNEPNIMFWKGTAEEFYNLTIQTAIAIRKADPDAHIIGGGFWGTPVKFIKDMHNSGAMNYLDGISFHPYAANPGGSMVLHDKLLDTLSELNYTGPVWITEIGYPTGGWYLSRVSINNYPSYILKTIAGASARGPRILLWYELFDSRNEGEISNIFNSSEKFFGLAYPNYQRKEGAYAFELCANYLPGSQYIKEYPIRDNISKNIISFCFINKTSGNNVLIIWNDRKNNEKIRLQLSVPALSHDIATGTKKALNTDQILEVNNTPLFITWQGESIPRLVPASK